MLDELRRRAPFSAARLILLAAVALMLGACDPPEAEGGYDKLTHRTPEYIPPASNPPPPPAPPAGAAGGAGAQVVAAELPEGVTQEMVDQGQELYGTVCVACHGAGGTGSPVAPPLNDAEWLNITGEYPEIVSTITSGVPQPQQYPAPMPPMGGGNFTEDQVNALAAYVYALSHQGGT